MNEVKKKILIVNNNMKIGGVQKALVALLKRICNQYDVTLLLFSLSGDLLKDIPSNVKVIETKGLYKYLGISQHECSTLKEKAVRGLFAGIAKSIGFRYSIQLLTYFNKKFIDKLDIFDVAIAYLHCDAPKNFYGGTVEYVLNYQKNANKVCYIHCDYINSGMKSCYSNHLYQKFNSIIGVSNSVAEQFVKAVPSLQNRVFALINPLDISDILNQAEIQPYKYDPEYLNCLTVARLSAEKGIERFIKVIKDVGNPNVRYYIVGDGNNREIIESEISEYNLSKQVFLLGEQKNPYRYMRYADLLVVPSFHEAAPVVFQEAFSLELPVLTTNTLSANEMIGKNFGFVVENSEEGLKSGLIEIMNDTAILRNIKNNIAENNDHPIEFLEKFESAIDLK